MNTVPIGRITKPNTLRPPVATAAIATGAEVLDLDRVGERDRGLRRAREDHRHREREQLADAIHWWFLSSSMRASIFVTSSAFGFMPRAWLHAAIP